LIEFGGCWTLWTPDFYIPVTYCVIGLDILLSTFFSQCAACEEVTSVCPPYWTQWVNKCNQICWLTLGLFTYTFAPRWASGRIWMMRQEEGEGTVRYLMQGVKTLLPGRTGVNRERQSAALVRCTRKEEEWN
jgi:hypothetical protein